MSVTVKFSDPKRIIARLGIKPGGDAHQYFMDRAAARMKRYLPWRDKGSVYDAQQQGIDYTKGRFVYRLPYAAYLYYGKVMAGKPKEPIDKNLVYTKHPNALAGPKWDVRMMENEGDQLAEEVTEFLQKGK